MADASSVPRDGAWEQRYGDLTIDDFIEVLENNLGHLKAAANDSDRGAAHLIGELIAFNARDMQTFLEPEGPWNKAEGFKHLWGLLEAVHGRTA